MRFLNESCRRVERTESGHVWLRTIYTQSIPLPCDEARVCKAADVQAQTETWLVEESVTESWREIRLPEDLCRAAEQKYGSQFPRLEEFLGVVLQNLVNDEAAQMDEAEARIVEERLRDLGYI